MAKNDRLLPEWVLSYERTWLRHDLTAGLTVAVMLIPQAMAYAVLAGLPPVMGLYASTVPLIVYALFGSSRQLAVGPVAIVSLLVFSACSRVGAAGSPEYIQAALVLALLVGIMQAAAGFLRLGVLVNFVSHAVTSGFTAAAAILIGLSQLKHILGIPLGSHHSVFKLIVELAGNIQQTNVATLVTGLAGISILYVLKRKLPRVPGPLVVIVAGVLAVQAFGLSRVGVATVGAVPGGLPPFGLPNAGEYLLEILLPSAAAIFLVGYMESISIAKYVAARNGYEIAANRELIGLGAANAAAAMSSGYPVTGGLSRTAVNNEAGARTQLASVITAATVMLTLLLFTPLFRNLPKAVLAAIVLAAVSGLVDYREAVRLFRIKAADGWTFLLTFAATLSFGVETGLLAGVALSLALFIRRSAHPHTAELGYVREEGVFRNLKRYPAARSFAGVLILRVDASLYFANARFLSDWIDHCIAARGDVKWVIIDMSGVNDIDAPGIAALEHMRDTYALRNVHFVFAAVKGPVRDLGERAGWSGKYAPDWARPSIERSLQEVGIRYEDAERG